MSLLFLPLLPRGVPRGLSITVLDAPLANSIHSQKPLSPSPSAPRYTARVAEICIRGSTVCCGVFPSTGNCWKRFPSETQRTGAQSEDAASCAGANNEGGSFSSGSLVAGAPRRRQVPSWWEEERSTRSPSATSFPAGSRCSSSLKFRRDAREIFGFASPSLWFSEAAFILASREFIQENKENHLTK